MDGPPEIIFLAHISIFQTEEQYLALKELGCDMAQGYYFSKPVPAESFEQILRERIKAAADGAAISA